MCFDVVWQFLQDSANYLYVKFNSQLGVAAIGSFFGAVGGYAMVMLTDRRKEIRSKVIAINTAITTSHMIFNTFFCLKKQHLQSLCTRYKEGKEKFTNIDSSPSEEPKEIQILFDFQTLQFPPINFNLINSKLFDKTDLPGRALSLAMVLANSMVELNNLLNYRHAIIDEINGMVARSGLNNSDRNRLMACLYYGKEFTHSQPNDIHYCKYSDTMEATEVFNDSCIWFSKELTEELIKVGKNTAKKLCIFRPRVGSVDYSDVDPELMPNDDDFKDWREKFVTLKN